MSDNSPGYHLIAELDAPGSGAWQGACQNSKTGEWFMAHSSGDGDLRFHRFGAADGIKKPYRDTMVVSRGGHAYGFGVSDSNILWYSHNIGGNDVVTMDYRPGRTVSKSQASPMHVFSDGNVQVSFSPTREGVVCMEALHTSYVFTKRLKDDILNNKDDPQGKPITLPKPSGTWLQGFSLAGDNLYVLFGKTASRSWIDKYDFDTGQKIGTLDITGAGPLPGERDSKARSREPEGMDARTFSVKIDHDAKRRLRVYQLDNF